MGSEPALAIAVSAREWPDRLRQWLADHGGARVRLTALTARDVEEDHHHVLVIDDISSLLTRGLVAREHARGRRVIGVYDPAEESGRRYLIDLAVDTVLASDEPAEQFVSAARALAAGSSEPRPSVPPPVPDRPGREGTLVDVRGISGGVGTSEVALGLARAIGTAVVVEFASQPSLAQRNGLDLHPNFVTAVEMVDHGNGDPSGAIQRLSPSTGVLVGTADLAAAGRGAARRVVDRIRARASWTLIDAGAESVAHVATDQTVFVTHATPVGISRCLDVFRHHDLINTHLVLNRAPRGVFERAEVMHAVLGEARPRSVTIICEDPAVTAAAWNGRPVESGSFVKAVASLAAAVVGVA
jgi:hypothetical protein